MCNLVISSFKEQTRAVEAVSSQAIASLDKWSSTGTELESAIAPLKVALIFQISITFSIKSAHIGAQ